jgi:uncharacterized membrane protein YkoI
VLRLVKNKYEGQVIHVDLVKSTDGLFYKIQLLDPQNRRFEVTVNAATRKIVSSGLY